VKDFIVIMGASCSNKLMPKYLDQLSKAEIPYWIESLPEITSPSDGTLGFCIKKWGEFAERFEDYERLILTDAWDVLFYGDHNSLAQRLSLFAPHVLFAGERNCYPEPQLAEKISHNYQPTPSTPWRFLNGGMLTSSPDELWRWCHEVERHPEYDAKMIGQQWLNRRMTENSPLARIDFQTRLFYCMYRENEGMELAVKDGKPYNTLAGTSPCLIHFNGSWSPEPFLTMMEGN
jgi:hypothetical protein